MKASGLLLTSVLLVGPLFACPLAGAQRPQGPPGPCGSRPGRSEMARLEPGADLLPPGRWWTNPGVIAMIGLTPEQRRQIEEIFAQNRQQLTQLHESLEEQQAVLEPMLDANPMDQGKTFAQIGKIADLRAELEKADAKMLLTIRGVLKAEQWSKLRAGPPNGPHPPPSDGPRE